MTPDQAAAELAGRNGRPSVGARGGIDGARRPARPCPRRPVSDLYGDRRRAKVRAYASSRGYLGGLSPESAWTDEAATSWDAGFRAMKLRIGRDPLDEEIDAIEGLVTASPPMTWMADGNGAYDMDESRRLGAALAELGFRWLEEPLPTDDYLAYAPLASELSIPLAGGEILKSADDTEPYLGLVRSTSSSPTSRSPAGSAASSRSRQPPTTPAGSPCRTPAAVRSPWLRRCTCWPSSRSRPTRPKWAEPILEHDVGENPIRTAILTEPLTLDDGWMTIPDGPGLGIEVDEVALRRLVA